MKYTREERLEIGRRIYDGEEFGVIYYRTYSTNPESSYISLDRGEFVVYYSSNLDLMTIPDYEKMIYSSKYYAEK